MARAYSLNALIDALVYEGHSSASAAALFNRKLEYIERVQRTSQYRNLLNSTIKSRNNRVSAAVNVKEVRELADEQIAAAPRAGDFNRIDTIEVVTGQERTDGFTYEQSNPPGTEFIFYTYGTQEDYINDENRLSGNEVTNISFRPETPPQEQGSFAVFVTYTVSVEGKIFARLKTE